MATNTKSVTKRVNTKPAAKKPVAKKAPAKKPVAASARKYSQAETYKLVEELVATGASHGDACQQVADQTSRAKSTIVTQHHLYRKSQGASPRARAKRVKAPAKPLAARALAPKRRGATDAAKAATSAIEALVAENAQLRRDLAAAEQRIERMLAAAKN
jgi:histone H1/5